MEKRIEVTPRNQDTQWEKVRIATLAVLIFMPIAGFISWIVKNLYLSMALVAIILVSSLVTTIYASILLQKRFKYVEIRHIEH